jgi:hypothetical protein
MKPFLSVPVAMILSLLPSVTLACGKPIYGPQFSGFSNTALELTEFDSIDGISRFYGAYPEDYRSKKIDVRTKKDLTSKYSFIMTIRENSVNEDGISARQWRIGIDKSGDGLIVKTAGKRWKCLDGKNTKNWTIKPCL